MLLTASIFSADRSSSNCLISSKPIALLKKEDNTSDSICIHRVQDFSDSTNDNIFNGALRMKTFRVLLELFNEAKRSEFGEFVEIPGKKLLKALNLKASGSAYSFIEKCIYELTFCKFEVVIKQDNCEEVVKHHGFIEAFFNGKKAYSNNSDGKESLNFEKRRLKVWTFRLSYLSDLFLNNTPLARVSEKVWQECGRSPIKQWLYGFYASHGGGSKLVFDYSFEKLLNLSGIINSIKQSKAKEALDEPNDSSFIYSPNYSKKALREQVYRFRRIIMDISRMRIFRRFKIRDKDKSKSSTRSLLSVARLSTKFEKKVWSTNLVDRINKFKPFLFDRPEPARL